MRLVTASLAAALAAPFLLAAPLAMAAPTHLTDVQFIAANRCLGLMSSKTLGTPDAAALKHLIDSESFGRVGFVYDRADQARDDARSDANRGGDAGRTARLVAERDGVCQSFLTGTTTASATAGSPSSIR